MAVAVAVEVGKPLLHRSPNRPRTSGSQAVAVAGAQPERILLR